MSDPRMNIQEIVDSLADTLGRSVVINDLEYRPIASSVQGSEIDHLRTEALLQRGTPKATRDYLEELNVNSATRPMIVDLQGHGGLQRLVVPVRDENGPLVLLWLITGGLPALSRADFSAIQASVVILRQLFGSTSNASPSTVRMSVMRRLLDGDATTRRTAFRDAVQRHWLERGPGTIVRACFVGDEVGPIDRVAFGQHLAALKTPAIGFLGERDNKLVFVSNGRYDEETAATIRSEAERFGIAIKSIGSAHHDRADDDLDRTIGDAIEAAGIVAEMPNSPGDADIADLGGWMFLSEVGLDRAKIARFSPAAYALCFGGDLTQRKTVEIYLDLAGQSKQTCDTLHVHRTTLYYRLENMPQVVKEALADGMKRSTLHLTLKLVRLWEETGRF